MELFRRGTYRSWKTPQPRCSRGASVGILIGILITFLVIVLVLYLINMPPIDGRQSRSSE
jgi:hypothetical protein